MSSIDDRFGNRPAINQEPRPSVEAARGFPPRRPPTAVGIIDHGGPPYSVEPSRKWYMVSYWKRDESTVLQHGVLSDKGVVTDVDATLVLTLKQRFFGLMYEFNALEFVGKVDIPGYEGNLVKRIRTLRSFAVFHFVDHDYRSCIPQYERLNPGGESTVNIPDFAGVMNAPRQLMEILRR